ncbi:MAG: helix-turn-helix domain-containing protein [Acidobacteria bacterium]|nr:helix-turn-helix domain-containing protein [Acidobacteriota bacterium]
MSRNIITLPTDLNSKSEILEYCKIARELISNIESKEKQRLAVESEKHKEINSLHSIAKIKSFLTLEEVGEILRLSKSKIYSLVTSGEIPSKKFGRVIRISVSELIGWLETNY